jgi:threonine dehydratase
MDSSPPDRYLERILRARVYDVARETPLDLAPRLSARLGNQVWIKREDLQPVFAFKIRGAYHKLCQLTAEERARGVLAASAGNHAQGVACAAKHLGVQACIVMPTTAPAIKVDAVRAWGAEVVLVGDNFDEAYAHAQQLLAARGLTFVHPYDDPDVIAGQGTVGLEILRQHRGPLDAIFVPVGGGGLIAGVSAYVKHVMPEVKIIGVEPDDAACLYAARRAGHRVTLKSVGNFADGVAVKQIGAEPFRLAQQYVDDVLVVDADMICAAIKDIFEDTRSVAEGAGALGVAGLKRYVEATGARGGTFVAIDSGANINFDRLRHVAERAELGEQREALFAVTIPERPGAFRTFCELLGKLPVTEFNYRYGDHEAAHIFVGVGLSHGAAQREALKAQLMAAGLPVVDMTGNEMAKVHVRYMVGGRAGAHDERLFRVEFPERPGALLEFLNGIGGRWNISLFHYRNHGAAFGRVLIGMQVPDAQRAEFAEFLRAIGYDCQEETDNPAYRLFLR